MANYPNKYMVFRFECDECGGNNFQLEVFDDAIKAGQISHAQTYAKCCLCGKYEHIDSFIWENYYRLDEDVDMSKVKCREEK